MRRFYKHRCVLSFSDDDGVGAEEGSDAFDADSDFATPSTRSRKRSSMAERESFSELPGLPEDMSKPVLTLSCVAHGSPAACTVRLAD